MVGLSEMQNSFPSEINSGVGPASIRNCIGSIEVILAPQLFPTTKSSVIDTVVIPILLN